jgi:hypothetical protein
MCVIKQVVYTCIYMLDGQDILYVYRLVYYVVLYEYVYTKTCLKWTKKLNGAKYK